MLVPASTGSGESDLVSARLAEVFTVVSSVAVLSEVSGSNTPEVVLAVLEMLVVREESTLTTRVTDLLAPLVIVVRFHPTTPAVRVPPPVAETKRSEEHTSELQSPDHVVCRPLLANKSASTTVVPASSVA